MKIGIIEGILFLLLGFIIAVISTKMEFLICGDTN